MSFISETGPQTAAETAHSREPTLDVRDALIPLAHALHATPSSHVLLVGAGVSKAAGLPSAWGVLTALIQDIAAQRGDTIDTANGQDPGDAACAWYERTFEREPSYQAVLAELAPTSTERQRVLRAFFETPPQEVEDSLMQPSAAHRAIGALVKSGHLRIIVTLNFDPLIERAIRDEGIEPTVASSAADLAGLAPLHTHNALVVHLHGQHLAASTMRNTFEELAAYDEVEDWFLDRLFTDYGVVAVGWSGTYDPALRTALARNRCPHFTSFWVEPGQLSEVSEQLRVLRGMRLITADADTALGYLADAVAALRDSTTREPGSAAIAVAVAKRQLAGERTAIGLHDMLNAEFARVRNLPSLDQAAFGTLDEHAYPALLARLESELDVSTALVATTAFWGNATTDEWIVNEIERSARPVRAGGLVAILRLPHLPALVWSYAASIAAAAAGRWQMVRRLLLDTTVQFPGHELGPAATELTLRMLELNKPFTYLFDMLEPLFTRHLGFTRPAWIDAWETVELVRVAIEADQRQPMAVAEALASVRRAELVNQDTALEAYATAVASLAAGICVRPIHIRVHDIRMNDQYMPETGRRLAQSLRSGGERHPLATSGLLGESAEQSELLLDAVNAAVASAGDKSAWSKADARWGTIPDYIWLDTGEVPQRDS